MDVTTVVLFPVRAAFVTADSALMVAEGSLAMTRSVISAQAALLKVNTDTSVGAQIGFAGRMSTLMAEDRALGQSLRPGGPLDRFLQRGGVADRLTARDGPLDRLLAPDGPIERLFEPGGIVDRSLEPGGFVDRLVAPNGTLERLTARGGIIETLVAEQGAIERVVGVADQVVSLTNVMASLAPNLDRFNRSVDALQEQTARLTELAARFPPGRWLRRSPSEPQV
ncbi:ABC transporter [Antrihabitans stalactiti]|uniref:ABC transporter n=1 Tax=Antrihabitans stalactiti TaxID=2584121 RepID=A0A848KFW5_9NOCA|nr:ABC transporter [Antrihabitans stalactiti]